MKNLKYERINFKDHIVEYPNRVEIKDNADGTKNIIPKQGEVLERGTAHSANTMNRLDKGIYDAHLDIFTVEKELERIRVQLELDGRVPNSNGAFFDVLDGSEPRNITLDKARADVVEDIAAGTLNIPVDNVEGFKVFTEVTIFDDVNMENVLITAIEGNVITVNKLENSYKKGAVVARSTVDIDVENQSMGNDVWGAFDISVVEVV